MKYDYAKMNDEQLVTLLHHYHNRMEDPTKTDLDLECEFGHEWCACSDNRECSMRIEIQVAVRGIVIV